MVLVVGVGAEEPVEEETVDLKYPRVPTNKLQPSWEVS